MAGKPILKALNPQLAKPWNTKAVKAVLDDEGYVYAQVKADGIRCLITRHLSTGQLIAVSRTGILIKSLTTEILLRHFKEHLPYYPLDFYIDCEVTIEGMPFEAVSGHIRRDKPLEGAALENLRFNLFNARDLQFTNSVAVSVLLRNKCATMEQIHDFYTYARQMGYEGIIVKDPAVQPYTVRGRKNGWWKMKPSETVDGTIVSIHQGTGKYSSCMGFIRVLLEDGTETDVGTGFSDALRVIMFEDQPRFIGRSVELAFMERTITGNLRHPAFKAFRDLEYAKGEKL